MSTFIETLKRGANQILPRTISTAVTMVNGDTVETAVNSKADASTLNNKQDKLEVITDAEIMAL